MTRATAEILILTINALGAGILLFVAGVIQKTMNGMDEARFKDFLNSLTRSAMTNPFAVTIATLPFVTAIAYFAAYGFRHWWFTAGFAVWIIGSTITKISNMPIYSWVGNPDNRDAAQLARYRRKLGLANNFRAWITFASVILMACAFGVWEVAVALLVALVLAPPLLWIARKYIPN